MARWDTLGYVPDSEDEDEEEEFIPKNDSGATVGLPCDASRADGNGSKEQTIKGPIQLPESTDVQDGILSKEEVFEKSRDHEPQNRTKPAVVVFVKKSSLSQREELQESADRLFATTEIGGAHKGGHTSSESGHQSIGVHARTPSSAQEDAGVYPLSDTDSPLSSIPEDFDQHISDVHSRSSSINSNRMHSPSGIEDTYMFNGFGIDMRAEQSEDVNRAQTIRRRNLRERKAIQLHPYMLESERYRQFLKARGIKPLRIVQPEAQRQAQADENDSGDSDFHAEDDTQPMQGLEGSSQPVPSSPAGSGSLNGSPLVDIGDDLPDVDELLRSASSRLHRGTKRQKLAHGYGSKTRIPRETEENMTSGNKTRIITPNSVFDLPLSPSSGGEDSDPPLQRTRHSFIFPRGWSPDPLPTPTNSTEARKSRLVDMSEGTNSEDEEGEGGPPERLSGTSRSPSRSSKTSNENKEDETHSFERRLRGVLPASWLKLDRSKATVTAKNTANKGQRSPSKPQNVRGVAIPVTSLRGSRSLSRSLTEAVEISSDSDDYLGDLSSLKRPNHRHVTDDTDFYDESLITANEVLDGDVEEFDTVDPMFPTQSRSKRVTGNSRRLNPPSTALDIQRQGDHGSDLQGRRKRSTHQPKITEHLNTRARPQEKKEKTTSRKEYRVSILDATERHVEDEGTTPNFIRIARRHARKRKDKGKQAPRNKYIDLEDQQSNAQVSQILRSWRSGLLVPSNAKYPTPATLRRTLAEGSGNHGRPRDNELTTAHKVPEGILYIHQAERQPSLTFAADLSRGTEQQSKRNSLNIRVSKRYALPLRKTALDPRPAQLESLESTLDSLHRKAAFQRNLLHIDRQFRADHHIRNFQLAQFLTADNHTPTPERHDFPDRPGLQELALQKKSQQVIHKPRKRTPHHVNLEQRTLKDFLSIPQANEVLESVNEIPSLHDLADLERGFENWTPVKTVINRLTTMRSSHAGEVPRNFGSLCRAVFAKCHFLINEWHWYKSEPVIGALFDFFARNNLGHLKDESSRGSPRFLQELDRAPSLVLEPGDLCFHILLKVIGSGLRAMRKVYTDKKIGDIAWRLMPNHGRQYLKEEAVREEDLDSLRNHHDLLSTLYWAAPVKYRPRVSLIRDLVYPEKSHNAACHISLQTWLNLVKFQLSVEEPAMSLRAFEEWHSGIISQMLSQHKLARTEAQADAAAIGTIRRSDLEALIRKNQQQIELILSEGVHCLHDTITLSKDVQQASILFSRAATSNIIEMPVLQSRRFTDIIADVLRILDKYLRFCEDNPHTSQANEQSDDSQEYGDWGDIEDAMLNEAGKDAITYLHEAFYESMLRLLSNCFGSDKSPNETFLVKVVESWANLATLSVKFGLKEWNNYIGPHSPDSWSALRRTKQTRRFTSYFLAIVMGRDPTIYTNHEPRILSFWMCSLADPEDLIRYHHLFTMAILNGDTFNPLLINLPFVEDVNSGKSSISLVQFSQRRLSLISSVLSNLRNAAFAESGALDLVSSVRQNYKNLLKDLMASMKENYDETSGTGDASAYTLFVQRIVELLQEYTAEVCPVDKFFTDSTHFPLPATDPTYVVGRLKNYGLRLSDPRVPKQLAVFFQTVSERAALEGQHVYLADQIYAALCSDFEIDGSERLALGNFMLDAILPSYLEGTFADSCAWIVARPVLTGISRMLDGCLVNVDAFETGSVQTTINLLNNLLSTFVRALAPLVERVELLHKGHVLTTLALFFYNLSSMVPTVDYLDRVTGSVEALWRVLESLEVFAASTIGLDDSTLALDSELQALLTPANRFEDVKRFASLELQGSLANGWVEHDGQYFVVKGSMRKVVPVHAESMEEGGDALFTAVQEFCGVMEWVRHGQHGRAFLEGPKKPGGMDLAALMI